MENEIKKLSMEITIEKINVRISQVAKAVITDSDILRQELSSMLDVQDRMIIMYLRDNEWNNRLTLKGCLLLIEKHTGLTENQILEFENK